MTAELSLWSLRQGEKGEVVSFRSQMPQAFLQRLKELGFHSGEIIECVGRSVGGGSAQYCVGNTVYALDQELAAGVLVKSWMQSKGAM